MAGNDGGESKGDRFSRRKGSGSRMLDAEVTGGGVGLPSAEPSAASITPERLESQLRELEREREEVSGALRFMGESHPQRAVFEHRLLATEAMIERLKKLV